MNQLLSVWSGLDTRKRVISIVSTIAVFLAVLTMAQVASRPNMALLYAQLQETAAGDVIRALEQRNVAYDVRGGAIYVDATRRDELRLTLASEGLPANGPQGYELLDSLNGFGTTAQMFDAAYWRAKEGELARTILASAGISAARVHLANEDANPFQRDNSVTASVFLTSATGSIDGELGRAMRYLVASAVPRLDPKSVSIIDSSGHLIASDVDQSGASTADDKASDLRDRVQRLVEARVGRGNAVVEVSVDTVTESESIFERHVDPESRVAISTDSEERTNSTEGSGGGVTVASNLPDGDAANGEGSRSQDNESRERVNYEVSETTREIIRSPGAIRRLSVAVMVNGLITQDADGASLFTPLPETEINALRELVASAVGFDESRGDQITIRSMAFEEKLATGTSAITPPWYQGKLDPMALTQLGVLGLVAIILGMFVVRPILTSPEAQPVGLPSPEQGLDGGDLLVDADNGPDLAGALEPPGGELPALVSPDSFDTGFAMADTAPEDPIDRMRELIEERREETVEVLRSWLDEKEEA